MSEDHPRVCGEKRIHRLQPHLLLGSPPRVRGKEPIKIFEDTATGITPACAGKRCCCSLPYLNR